MSEAQIFNKLDSIHIRDLSVRCIVGIRDWERKKKQDVLINLTLHANLAKACASDLIEDTIDYKSLKDRIIQLVENSKFQLIERLADAVAETCLAEARVKQVDVTVDKPGALRFARSVAVEITRAKGE
ncbi:MAG: dihydroneopterin aldolase [Deltaproteobacteria bacterium]|nr:dihydroneopterin aldolase [Deltaproteobacteria bacterium]